MEAAGIPRPQASENDTLAQTHSSQERDYSVATTHAAVSPSCSTAPVVSRKQSYPNDLRSVSAANFDRTHSPTNYVSNHSQSHVQPRPALRSVSTPLHKVSLPTTNSSSTLPRLPRHNFKDLVDRFNGHEDLPPLPPQSHERCPSEQSSANRSRLPKPRSPARTTPSRISSHSKVSPASSSVRTTSPQNSSPLARSHKRIRVTPLPSDLDGPNKVSRGPRRGSESCAQNGLRQVSHRRSLSETQAAEMSRGLATADGRLLTRSSNNISTASEEAHRATLAKPSKYRPVGKENFASRIPITPPIPPFQRSHTRPRLQESNSQPARAHANVPATASPTLRNARVRKPFYIPQPTRSVSHASHERDTAEMAQSTPRKSIPELTNVDFAERRARIERAISQTIDDRDVQAMRKLDKGWSISNRDSVAISDRTSSVCESVTEDESPSLPGAFPVDGALLGDVQGRHGFTNALDDQDVSNHDSHDREPLSLLSTFEDAPSRLDAELRETARAVGGGPTYSDQPSSGRGLLTNMLQARSRDSSSTEFTRDSIASFSESLMGEPSVTAASMEDDLDENLAEAFRAMRVRQSSGSDSLHSGHQDDNHDSHDDAQADDSIDNDHLILTPRSKPLTEGILNVDLDRTPRPLAPMHTSSSTSTSQPRDLCDGTSTSTSDTQDESEIDASPARTGFSNAAKQVQGVLNSLNADRSKLARHNAAKRSTSEQSRDTSARITTLPVEPDFDSLDFRDSLSSSGRSLTAQSQSSGRSGSGSNDTASQNPTSSQDTLTAPLHRRMQSERPPVPPMGSASYLLPAATLHEAGAFESKPVQEQGLGLTIDVGLADKYSPLPALPFEESNLETLAPPNFRLSRTRTAAERVRSSTNQVKTIHRNSCPSPSPISDETLLGFQRRHVLARARSSAEPQLGETPLPSGQSPEPPEVPPKSPLTLDEPQSLKSSDELTSEQRRLIKRRNVIKELLDTEYSHHQDMKIVLDIYKATVGELITPDDKQVLFGNIHKVEAFSLEFYDALKPAVSPFYIPQRSSRWHAKRASVAASTSDNPADILDQEKDRMTCVGRVFMTLLPKMEEVYGTYLRNHDGANQRLAKLQTDPTVECWLTECHKNASDITTAWDLDSLLVKPVQRVLKYPLLLQQLLEVTAADHPDRPELAGAVQESLNISQRINEAKKRADLVEQIVTRKRKDNDVKAGIAKAFGRRGDRLKDRLGVAEAYQDPVFDELAHKFGGHFIRLQVCMRDVQGSLIETGKAVECFNSFASALETYVEVSTTAYPMILNKWRKYALAIRELAAFALTDHTAQIKKRVVDPMMAAVKLHEGPQNAIAKRKQTLVDYARCKSMESKGEKPDKRTLEDSQLFGALNEQLKIDLPRLYQLTARLIQACLACHLDIQKEWMWTWENKLRPVIDKFPQSIAEIEPNFIRQFEACLTSLSTLTMCNGSLLADVGDLLSPSASLMNDSTYSRAPSVSARTLSVGSELSHGGGVSGGLTPDKSRSARGSLSMSPMLPPEAVASSLTGARSSSTGPRRSNSSISQRQQNLGAPPDGTLPARMPSGTSRYSGKRVPTLGRPAEPVPSPSYNKRYSTDTFNQSPRPGSGASYFMGQPDYSGNNHHHRYSEMYSSTMSTADNMSTYQGYSGSSTPRSAAEGSTPVLFVAASLFEFNIDRARKESGYPYLTYVQGEVFDVLSQKGELWLARNQDDATGSLGWIWEQHFVILSQEA